MRSAPRAKLKMDVMGSTTVVGQALLEANRSRAARVVHPATLEQGEEGLGEW